MLSSSFRTPHRVVRNAQSECPRHRAADRRQVKVWEEAMAQKSLEERVDNLERRVEILERLPERVTALETQIVQLRDEMRAEFSATRTEARTGDEGVIKTLRDEIRAGDEHVVKTLRDEIRAGDEHVVKTLRDEIRAGDEETRRFMRILHEEVIERIRLLGGMP